MSHFKASPNPFKEYLTIDFSWTNSTKQAEFILTDIVGREIKRVNLEKTQTKIKIDKDLVSGIYFGQIRLEDKWSTPIKLLRQ